MEAIAHTSGLVATTVIGALTRCGALRTEVTFQAFGTRRTEPVTGGIVFALTSAGENIALRSVQSLGLAEIDGAVHSACGAVVEGNVESIRDAGASAGLIVAAGAITAVSAQAAGRVVRAVDAARGSGPKRFAGAGSSDGSSLHALAFATETLVARLANVAQSSEIAVAEAGGASLRGRVVGAEGVVAVSVVGVASAADVT